MRVWVGRHRGSCTSAGLRHPGAGRAPTSHQHSHDYCATGSPARAADLCACECGVCVCVCVCRTCANHMASASVSRPSASVLFTSTVLPASQHVCSACIKPIGHNTPTLVRATQRTAYQLHSGTQTRLQGRPGRSGRPAALPAVSRASFPIRRAQHTHSIE